MNFQLNKLLQPRSIAVVGASERPDAIGTRVIRNLRRLGFSGRIYPVNPRYREIEGLACVPTLSALPEPVDAAFFAVPAQLTVGLMDEAAANGIRAVFMNANGFADGDAAGRSLQQRVTEIARTNGIAVCGPNNLGLINVFDKVAAWTPRYMMEPKEGPIALISQSGSIAIVLADDERKIGFSYLITAGNEAVLSVADYLQYVVRDDRVHVILLYLETIWNPEAFAAAAKEALQRRNPSSRSSLAGVKMAAHLFGRIPVAWRERIGFSTNSPVISELFGCGTSTRWLRPPSCSARLRRRRRNAASSL